MNKSKPIVRYCYVPGMIFKYSQRPECGAFFPYVSIRATDLFGLGPDVLAGDAVPIFAAIHPEDIGAVRLSLLQSAHSLALWHTQFRVRQPTVEFLWYEGQATPERLADGGTSWYGYIADIQKRKNAEGRIAHMAQHDVLTGLPNRSLFDDRIAQAFSAARIGGDEFVVLWSYKQYHINMCQFSILAYMSKFCYYETIGGGDVRLF